MRYKGCIKQDWVFTMGNSTGAHINHSDLYERKGYHGYALEQLHNWDYWQSFIIQNDTIKT